MLTILYVGPDYTGSNGTSWRDALLQLGYDVRTVDSESFMPEPRTLAGLAARKLRGGPEPEALRRMNAAIVDAARRLRPDAVFYVKGPWVTAETLAETRRHGANLAYMNDDMFNPRNQTPTFGAGLPHFDCIFTTKSFNVREFHAAGAPLAIYVPNAYDPDVHLPVAVGADDVLYRGDVAFIGTFRPERADFLADVADRGAEFRLNVWGGGWHKMRRPDFWRHRRRWRALGERIRGPELWARDMGRAIAANRICLGLLNHDNRDLHTSRSFEIPACAGFMLAERTEEHRMYFEEDREAVYFSTKEELLDKLRFYLAHEDRRAQIAAAGYERCVKSAYRYVDRARFALAEFERITGRTSRPLTKAAGRRAGE